MENALSGDEKLSFGDAAPLLGISVHTLRHWARERRIPYFRCGRRVVFSRRDLDAFLRARRVIPLTGRDRIM